MSSYVEKTPIDNDYHYDRYDIVAATYKSIEIDHIQHGKVYDRRQIDRKGNIVRIVTKAVETYNSGSKPYIRSFSFEKACEVVGVMTTMYECDFPSDLTFSRGRINQQVLLNIPQVLYSFAEE